MKHGLSEPEMSWRSRPIPHTGRFFGGAMVASVVVPYYLWELGLSGVALFIPYLIVAAGVGVVVVFVRRTLRPPRAHLEQTFIEVTPGGIWRTTPNSRILILAAPQVSELRVSRYHFNEIVSIEIGFGDDTARFFGLIDMTAFLNDVLSTFVRCKVLEIEIATQHENRA